MLGQHLRPGARQRDLARRPPPPGSPPASARRPAGPAPCGPARWRRRRPPAHRRRAACSSAMSSASAASQACFSRPRSRSTSRAEPTLSTMRRNWCEVAVSSRMPLLLAATGARFCGPLGGVDDVEQRLQDLRATPSPETAEITQPASAWPPASAGPSAP